MNSLIPELVKNNQFLPPHNSTLSSKFHGADSEELFFKNLKTQPHDWYYRTAPVNYTLNQHGYRTREFDEIDWANSVVIFGCSNVFGVGVDDGDCLSSQLSKLLEIPVINMGVGASSMIYSLHNAVILRERYPTPLAVINGWTHYCRTVYYNENKCDSYGSWNMNSSEYSKSWILKDSHAQTHAIFASKISKLLWENTKYFEFSIFDDTAKILNCKWINSDSSARDCMHPGIYSHHKTAMLLADQLKL